MRIPDKVYDVLKWVILIFVPALTTFISGLGVVLGFDSTVITAIIGLVATFVGSLIGVSTKAYNDEKKRKENFENL
jgi:hypothetical protein